MSAGARTPGWTTLRRRTLLPALACGALLAIAAFLSLHTLGAHERNDRLGRRARLLAHVVADVCATARARDDLDRVVSAIGAEPEVDLIAIAGGTPARVIASTRHAWVGRPVAGLGEPEVSVALAASLRTSRESEPQHAAGHLLALTAPATFATQPFAGSSGTVLVRLDTASVDARVAAWSRDIAMLLLALFLAAACAAEFALRRYVLRPVGSLAAAAERRRAGDRDAALPVLANDEIGRLAATLADANRAMDEALHAREAVRETEARTRQIVDTALDAVLTIDSAGLITGWNAQAERTFGWAFAEVRGRKLSEVIIPLQYRGAHERGLARYLQTGEGPVLGQRIEISALRRDGTEFPVELAITPLRNDSVVSFSAFVRDISDRKRAESEIVQAKNAAQAASRAKSEFLATMSHEIRTPMNGVIGFTDLLLGTALDDDQRDYAQTIRSSGQLLMALINDILDFSRIEAGRLEVERVPFEARRSAAGVVELLAAKAAERGIELVLDWPVDVPANLNGDAMRFRQVLLNLTGNALKFTEAGAVTVRVERADGGALRIEVRDTGIGIDSDKLPALFRKFTQADSSTTRRFGGSGLGLAISKQLVELMGGTIGAESARGRGSTFWFTLPVATQPPADATSDAPEGPAFVAGLRVLVVDDLEPNRRVLRTQLETWGVSVVVADGGEAALAALRAGAAAGRPFDAALLDLQMPGMDGEALARAIHADPACGQPALVLLTSASTRSEARELLAAGFADVLLKPIVEPTRLRELIARVTNRTARAPLPEVAPPVPLPVRPREARTGTGARVLLAEDQPVNQKLAVRVIARAGCAVDVANDGVEACAMAAATDYDLIFMDCHMPRRDGFEATELIRAREAAQRDAGAGDRHTPIIALTASALREDRDRCFACGMDDFISKPFSPGDVEAAIARWVPVDRSERPAREAA